MTRHVSSRDVPGLRIVMVDSTDAPRGGGHVRHHQAAVVAELRATDRPAFVTMHHHPQRLPLPTFWPPGIPSLEANRFLGAVAAVKPATHGQHRPHPPAPEPPGRPARAHRGGLTQGLPRARGPATSCTRAASARSSGGSAPPDLLAWTDYTAGAVLGAWGLWAPGLLGHRCFSHTWPTGWN